MGPYFLCDANDEIVVALSRKSKRLPDRRDRIVWSKVENRYIYGDLYEYTASCGEENTPKLCVEEEDKEFMRKAYNTGSTQCGSAFYDRDGKLYEIYDSGEAHKLIFDANNLPEEDTLEELL